MPTLRRSFGLGGLILLALVDGVLIGLFTAGAALALFTDTFDNTENTFTTLACFTGDTGFADPTTAATDTGGDGDGFELNPTNAFADGGGYASNIDGAGDRQRYYNYGLSISSSCAIEGIEVRLDWWLDSTDQTNSMSAELSWDGGTSWTSAKTDSTETTTEHTATLGSSADKWGRTWAVSELNDANFRVRLTSNSDSSSRDFYLDWVPVKVYYAMP
jgi:hypothetical protein